jgi:hypothetical protein
MVKQKAIDAIAHLTYVIGALKRVPSIFEQKSSKHHPAQNFAVPLAIFM